METTDPNPGVDPFDALVGALGTDEPEETTDEEVSEVEPEQAEESGEAEETEAERIEFDGKTLEIPKGTPPELVESLRSMAADLKADYTRKTQEVAEGRRFVEARMKSAQEQEQTLSALFEKAVEYKVVAGKIAQLQDIDWPALIDENPQQAQKLNLTLQQLQRDEQRLKGELQQADAHRREAMAQAKQQKLQEAQKDLLRRIPKWTADTGRAISEHAQKYGFTAEELAEVSDPRMVEALHDAMQWRRLQAEKPKAMQKVANAPRAIKPGTAQPRPRNQAAMDRLKANGRIEDLAALLG